MIIVFEPFCEGFEHSSFNAAFLQTVCLAYPDEEIRFYAEKEHLQLVSKWVCENDIKNITFYSLIIPNKNKTTNLKRIFQDIWTCFKMVRLTSKLGATKFIISTISTHLLYTLKFIFPFYKNIKCFVIPHDILQTITKKPVGLKANILWFKWALLFMTPPNLKILTLGSITKKWLSKEIPKSKDFLLSIEMAYLFYNNKAEMNSNGNSIRFGFFGVGTIRKGADLFVKLSNDINSLHFDKKAEFVLIGKIVDEEINKMDKSSVIIPSSIHALSRDDFSKYAKNIDYAIILYDRKFYDILQGASIMDCLEFVKPVIALRTTFLEFFFSQMGDIGALCNNYDEVKKTIIELLQSNQSDHYNQQCQNMVSGRTMYTPGVLAKSYRETIQ